MRSENPPSIREHPNILLNNLLRAKGFKSTNERKIIFKELEAGREHFNADSLYCSINKKREKVSKPTIYRTLKLFEELHLIERFDIKKNCFYYDPVSHRGGHGHLICEECGRIVDFSIAEFDMFKSAIVTEKDFTVGSISIRAFGLCKSCLKASQKPQ